ncbi:hypothetical protein ON010_g16201 [Phytophthora cinnamomi]|nr:hypothetical protein ON010_g16201 [Phytophthora cinnamomi]
MRIPNNADDSFPLTKCPTDIVDGRKDRGRYPRMVPENISTLEIVQRGLAAVQESGRSEDQGGCEKDKALDKYRAELVRAALAAEVTALARVVNEGDIEEAVSRVSAVIECMGVQIASGLSPAARQQVVDISRDVGSHFRASKTQMMMYTNAEVDGHPEKYDVDHNFETIARIIELRVITDEEVVAIETTQDMANHARKRPRVSERKLATPAVAEQDRNVNNENGGYDNISVVIILKILLVKLVPLLIALLTKFVVKPMYHMSSSVDNGSDN